MKRVVIIILFSISHILLGNESPTPIGSSLTDLYGKESLTNGKITTKDNKLTSIWFGQSFKIGKDSFYVVFTKTQTIDIKTGEIENCHVCGVEIGAITYNLINHQWKALSKQKIFGSNVGSNGDAPAVNQAKIIELSKSKIAFLINDSYSNQGETDEWVNVFIFDYDKWIDAGNIDIGSDTSGGCENSETINVCYGYKGKIKVVDKKESEFPILFAIMHLTTPVVLLNYTHEQQKRRTDIGRDSSPVWH